MRFSIDVSPAGNPMEQAEAQGKSTSPTAFFNARLYERTGSYNMGQNRTVAPGTPVVADRFASRDEDMRHYKNRQRFPRKTDRRVDQNEREALEIADDEVRRPMPARFVADAVTRGQVLFLLAGGVEAEIGHGLLVKLPAGLDLLALLELLDGGLGLRPQPAIRATDLEPVLVERLLSLADLTTRQVLLRLIVLCSLLLLRRLSLAGLLLLCLWLLLIVRGGEHRRADQGRRQQRDNDLSHSAFSIIRP
jgi:hypothetical protein